MNFIFLYFMFSVNQNIPQESSSYKPLPLNISYLLCNSEEPKDHRHCGRFRWIYEHNETFRLDHPDSAYSSFYSNNKQVKRRRRNASKDQLNILENVFQKTQFPSARLREELANKLNMSPRAVQIWFQNKRQAFRKGKYCPVNMSADNNNNNNNKENTCK